MSEKSDKTRWKTKTKLKHLVDSFYLEDEKLGSYLRKNGLHTADLDTWKDEAFQALDGAKFMRNEERKRLQIKIKTLEKELEKANLKLEFQKKAQEILNPTKEEGNSLSMNDKESLNSSKDTDKEA